MPSEISEADSDSSSPSHLQGCDEKEKEIITAKSNIEVEIPEDDSNGQLSWIDKVELTPQEALKWNVDGDQSPCGFFLEWPKKIVAIKQFAYIYISPRGGSMRI